MPHSRQSKRTRQGVISGIIGLITNIILVIIKLIAGFTASSVSILADAMNSLGDGLSAILVIIGFYVANKPADREHPFGHQRAEYISGLFTSIIILFVGFQFLISSIQEIINPSNVESSHLVLYLLGLSIVIKGGLGFYYYWKNKNITIPSNALSALMKDSIYDMVINIVIIVSYIVEIKFGWYIDGYIGVLVAAMILHGGFTTILDSVNDLLGTRPNSQLVQQMQEVMDSYDNLVGYHDLILHKYGPNKFFATVDIEVDSRWGLIEAHQLIDTIEKEFKEKFDIILVGHLDPVVLYDKEQNYLYKIIKETLKSYDKDFHFHDFRIEESSKGKEIFFDVVVPDTYAYTNELLFENITKDVYKKVDQTIIINIEFDRDYLLRE